LEKVLRIRRSGNTDAIFIGNLFHDVLNQILLKTDIAYLDDFLDAAINNFLIGIDKTPNAKEKFFIGIYKDILIRLRNYISYTENNSDFEILGLEKEYQVVLRKLSPANIDVEVVINGKIDKVLSYKFGTSDYAVVIDYKTGNVDFDLNRIIHGLNMQIIFYFYFLNSNSEEFKFGGGYLEKVLPNNVFDSETNKTFDEQFNKFFKLNGYSNSNHNVLKAIDHNFEDDSFLNGIKLTKSGEFHSYSKNRVISDEEFEGLLNVGRNKIDEAINDIIKGKFDINPKKLGSIDSCRFCPYQDICYKENRDYQELKEYKGFSFLGEEE
jgi:ATP-dependent helicase/nuclease subunit B